LQSRVIFIDHREQEGEDKDIKQSNENSLSKVNNHEVKLIVKIVKYMLQQGYNPEQLVILTPYLGQLLKIKKALDKDKQTIGISKQDVKDLNQAGAAITVPQTVSSKAVRVATIDNYQGEEADIVIASLVRSNNANVIGFLRDPERVNVMLSRARHGMILLGNSDTLTNAKDKAGQELWKKLMSMFHAKNQVFKGLPTYCQQHPNEKYVLDTPANFEKYVPDGGCTAECGVILPCNLHKCPKKCHANRDHSLFICSTIIWDKCVQGHSLSYTCNNKNKQTAKICYICDKLKQQEEDLKKKEEEQAKEEAEQKAKDEIRMKEEAAKLEIAKRNLQSVENHQERELQSEKLRIEREHNEKLIELKKNSHQQNIKQQVAIIEQQSKEQLQLAEEKFQSNNNNYTPPKATQQVVTPKEAPTTSTASPPTPSSGSGNTPSGLSSIPSSSLVPTNPALKSGFQLLQDKKPYDALNFFATKLDDTDALYLAFYCQKLMGEDESLTLLEHNSLVAFYVRAYVALDSNKLKAVSYAESFLKNYSKLDTLIPAAWEKEMQDIVEKSKAKVPAVVTPPKIDAKAKWEKAKSVHYAKSAAIDELMTKTGLEAVKETILNIYDFSNLEKERKNDPKKMRTHARLEGNPGTGKTTVARIYAKFLLEIGALSGSAFEETSGAKLADGGVPELKQLIDKIEKANGGVLFIDEAYQLDSNQGKSVLNYLLTELENKIGSLTILFAGYKKDMEKLFEINEGLKSRFAFKFVFEDYTDDELLSILQGIIKQASTHTPYKIEEGESGRLMQIVSRRIGRQRGRGFGNARTVKNYFEAVLRRQASRLIRDKGKSLIEDKFFINKEDLVGPEPSVAIESCEAYRKLKSMIGLSEVKDSVEQIVFVIKQNYDREMELKALQAVTLNRVFIGNPGTGKTTVAKLYAQILKELGILSKGEVVFKTASEFVGAVLGESEKNTNAILKESEGCVLVIDEAYGLYSKAKDLYKEAVINTIVEKVQNVPGDDRCVLLLGYKEQMEEMMRESNPGLKRRFNFDNPFTFEDYNDEDLMKILNLKLKERQLSAVLTGKLAAIEALAKQRRQKNFGNGGAVENMISSAVPRFYARIKNLPLEQRMKAQLIAEDFVPKEEEIKIENVFADIIGCSEVLETLREYEKTIKVKRAQGRDPFDTLELNFLFLGSPGTGKTTVAKRMGMLFKSLGVLDSSDVVECSASDLVASYVGQTSPLTRAKVESALGKVLFIDEAYRLIPRNGNFCDEAINELVQMLTETKIKNKLVVILAGYEQDMNALIGSNPGLRSRFSQSIRFTDFSARDCWKLLQLKFKASQKVLPDDVCQKLDSLMVDLTMVPDFGNGREMETLAKRVSRYIDKTREIPTNSDDIIVTSQEMEHCLNDYVKEKKRVLPSKNETKQPEFQFQNVNVTPTRPNMSTKTEIAETPFSSNNNNDDGPNTNISAEKRDDNVSDEIWAQLQEAKRRKREEDERRKKEMARLEEEKRKAEEAARIAEEARRKLEEQIKLANEEKRKQLELEKQKMEEKIRQEKERAWQQHLAYQQLLDQQRAEAKRQQELRNICPAGFGWYIVGGGWRCGGGSHFVSNM
jgi:Holliday junction resolvasome RuvABC ATP-dependent DNA helicase subunit